MIARRMVMAAPLALAARGAEAAPKAEPWPLWEAHDAASTTVVDHSAWGAFLAKYRSEGADGIARVAYRAVTPADRAALEAAVARLASVPVSGLNRGEQFAYWVNLYNMVTVQVVLKHFPVASIRDIGISPGWFSRGPWGAKLVTVAGTPLSLDDIEHRILRPVWRDPRVHYAVNCAALGCPNLAAVPFTAAALETMLDAGARAYVNHPRGAAIESGRLVASSIYVWFASDFGPTPADVVRHLRQYAQQDFYTALSHIRQVSADRYDWALNAAES
jgi:hypothetical protein